jgi:hypothetical protein
MSASGTCDEKNFQHLEKYVKADDWITQLFSGRSFPVNDIGVSTIIEERKRVRVAMIKSN